MRKREVDTALARAAIRNRILLADTLPATPGDREGAIEAGHPFVRLDHGRPAFEGRRRTLRIERGSKFVELRARLRTVPDPGAHSTWVGHARDRKGQEVLVSYLDPSARTLRLLLDLDTAEIVETSLGHPPAGFLVENLVDPGLETLLGEERPIWVGSRVRTHLAEIMTRNMNEAVIRREIAFLERWTPGDYPPATLQRRLRALRQRARLFAGSRPKKRPEAEAELEVQRLTRLVQSRACSILRLREGGISGLICPRAVSQRRAQLAIGFDLELARFRGRPILHVWDPRQVEPMRRTTCLGRAEVDFYRFEEAGDVYALIDTVLNFCEGNLTTSVCPTRPVMENPF